MLTSRDDGRGDSFHINEMSFEDAFNFGYAGALIPIMLGMAEELCREKLVEILKHVASEQWTKQFAEETKKVEK